MKFRTPYSPHVRSTEVNNLPSMTVPDQSMSVAEMLARHASGLPISGAKIPLYEGDQDPLGGLDPRTLDLSELQTLRDEAIDREKEKRRQARLKDQEAAKARHEAAIEAAVKKRLETAVKTAESGKAGDQPA